MKPSLPAAKAGVNTENRPRNKPLDDSGRVGCGAGCADGRGVDLYEVFARWITR